MKEKIKQDILKISQSLQKHPIGRKDYQKYGTHAIATVKKYFGSWFNAVKEIFNIEPKINPPKPKIIINCKNCGTKTTNPKFCNNSCAASFLCKTTNGRKIGKKRISTNTCIICNSPIAKNRKRCDECKFYIKTKNDYKHISELTIKDILTEDTQKYRRIRTHARKIAKENNKLECCAICKYNKHVECAHIKPIKKFPKSTLISIVNDPDNLIGLCPNCHWEFDNELLKLACCPSHS